MTKFKAAMIAIAASLAGATAAYSEPAPGVATLAAEAHEARVAGDAGVWRCDGITCTGTADTRTGLAVEACTMVAGANGRVAAFTAGATSFGEPELKRCNRHVK